MDENETSKTFSRAIVLSLIVSVVYAIILFLYILAVNAWNLTDENPQLLLFVGMTSFALFWILTWILFFVLYHQNPRKSERLMRKWSPLKKAFVISSTSTVVFGIVFFFYIVYVNNFDFRIWEGIEIPIVLVLCFFSVCVFLILFGILFLIFLALKKQKSKNQ
jgi:amino acid transporter